MTSVDPSRTLVRGAVFEVHILLALNFYRDKTMKKTLATLLEYLPCVRHSPEDLTCKPYHFAGDEIETQRIILFGPAMQLEEKDLTD